MHSRTPVSLTALAFAAGALIAAAPAAPSLTFDAVAGATHYTAAGTGQCGRETAATLHDKPATLYLIEYTGGGSGNLKRVRLTLWQFRDGSPDQLSLAFDAGRDSYSISTLEGSRVVGKGSATVRGAAHAGNIVIKGQDARGVPIAMTVACSEFGGIEAEGG